MNTWPLPLLIILLLTSCSTIKSELTKEQIETGTSCNISLITAKTNLNNYGFKLESSDKNGFKTKFKFNLNLQERRMFGSIDTDVYEKYEVTKTNNKIVYKIIQKIVNYPHPDSEETETTSTISSLDMNNIGLKQLSSYKTKICSAKSYADLAKEQSNTNLINRCLEGVAKACFKQSQLEKARNNKVKAQTLFFLGCHFNPENTQCEK